MTGKITSMVKLEIGREYNKLAGKDVMIFYGVLLLCWIFFKVTGFSLTLISLGLLPREHNSETPTFFVKESSESEGILVDTWNMTSTVEVAKYGVVNPVLLFFCSPPIKPQWFVRFT